MFRLTPYNQNNVVRRNSNLGDFYSLFDDYFKDGLWPTQTLNQESFKIDVKELENEYHFVADLPGVKKEEVTVDYKENRLVINVTRMTEESKDEDNYLRRERSCQSMQRAFTVNNLKSDSITAKLEDGVLTIVAPKQVEVDTRYKIEIQ